MGIVVFQIAFSLIVSYLLVIPHTFYIPTNVANQVLSSLIDVSIALFGFVGLILVFTLRNLLTTKGNLQKEKFNSSITKIHYDRQLLPTLLYDKNALGHSMEAIEKYEQRLEEIDKSISHNKKQINDALFFGVVAIGFAVSCTFMSILAFGAISNGLHFLHLALPFSLFFMCFDFIVVAIKTVID